MGATAHACCRNCEAPLSERPKGGRGFCNVCYRLHLRKEKVTHWDKNKPETWSESLVLDTVKQFTQRQFEDYRLGVVGELDRRLATLKRRTKTQRCEESIDPLELEMKFAEVMRLVRRNASYPSNASYLGHHLDESQRRVVYALLDEIVAEARWGIDWGRVFSKVYPH